VYVTAETKKGAAMSSLYPNLRGFVDQTMVEADLERIGGESDVTIVSLPSGMAMSLVPDLLKQGTKVIDVAADFRLKQAELYPQWYKLTHTPQSISAKRCMVCRNCIVTRSPAPAWWPIRLLSGGGDFGADAVVALAKCAPRGSSSTPSPACRGQDVGWRRAGVFRDQRERQSLQRRRT
jgi:hypothetical protein